MLKPTYIHTTIDKDVALDSMMNIHTYIHACELSFEPNFFLKATWKCTWTTHTHSSILGNQAIRVERQAVYTGGNPTLSSPGN